MAYPSESVFVVCGSDNTQNHDVPLCSSSLPTSSHLWCSSSVSYSQSNTRIVRILVMECDEYSSVSISLEYRDYKKVGYSRVFHSANKDLQLELASYHSIVVRRNRESLCKKDQEGKEVVVLYR